MSTNLASDATATKCPEPSRVSAAYQHVRGMTQELCSSLEIEDMVAQSMPAASPVRWHLAHTTWFFETFILKPHKAAYQPASDDYEFLFNSYYNSIGKQPDRAVRGMMTRPTLREVLQYRSQIDDEILSFIDQPNRDAWDKIASVMQIGLQHEQQHQELILTDVKHLLSLNPLRPAFRQRQLAPAASAVKHSMVGFDDEIAWIGHEIENGFCFDNETPRHQCLLRPYGIGNRLITCGEFLEFIHDGGYQCPHHWLSAGWDLVQRENWTAPLYWSTENGDWSHYTLFGTEPLPQDAPVCHVSFFEADAFARWKGVRLPTEFEWEHASRSSKHHGNFVDSLALEPSFAPTEALSQMLGDCWEWTGSPYVGYPGYRASPGAIGEYNGKFMCNQYVLRGGSLATSQSHIRPSYRNFFPPEARWQFSGVRVATDA